MEILTLALAAGETKSLRKAGSYIEILSASGAVALSLYGLNAGITNSITQGLSGLFLRADFAAFDITNEYGVAQTVQLLVCDAGEDGGSRRQPGTVRVIDSSTDKTLQQRQFLASNANGADAAKVSVVCINANGGNCSIKRLIVSSSVAGTFTWGFYTAPGTATPLSFAVNNKRAFAASSQAMTGASVIAAAAPTAGEIPGYVQTVRMYLLANQSLEIRFPEPLIITGTQGLVVNGNAINRDLACAFEIEEWT